ncbi:hypothetical protein EYZ11_011101 [Aspergillus tanneri]|uniref:Hydrophobin n=1 Tax=Aspergillus tanneri TaxID=1220188 RepID=A0A4S3J3N3_9EURO|nr:uncharacterized protein ATNIH1004_000342 [Aspergillus tanneri]KAA8651459.1 hypothetical protein ATNIH1004_000342 [Aspergillus tanneri]THC89459.1 hypothetical protein EYZ11_011101 [Aspergillus tanneri]
MHFSTLLTLATTVTLATAKSYYCLMGQDKTGFIQNAYCCNGYHDMRGNDIAKGGIDCTEMKKDVREICPDGNTPKCCYTIGAQVVCTAEAVVNAD